MVEIPAHELARTRFCSAPRCTTEVGPGEDRCRDHRDRPRLPARLLADPLGLELGDVDFAGWADVVAQVGRIESASAWWLGDLLRDERFDDDHKYAAAIEATGHSLHRLYSFCWVARAVPRARRRRSLSWSHHRAVAALSPDQQVAWLQRALDEQLRVFDLERALGDAAVDSATHGSLEAPANERQADGLVPIRVEIRAPAAHVDWWRRCAGDRGVPLGTIVAALLERELGPFPDKLAAG